jgi:GNAT superfamily N-acetyltransferase
MAVVDIRKAKPRDLRGVLSLSMKFATYEAGIETTVKATPTATRKRSAILRREFRTTQSHFLMAMNGKHHVGYAWGSIRKLDATFTQKAIGCIREIYVEESYRRQGVGRALAEELMLWFRKRKVHLVEATTFTNNLKGRGFLQSEGFYINAFRQLKKI